MENKILTCIECPMGCTITAQTENGAVKSVSGNGCPRGKLYAENEVICPVRVLTTTVKTTFGKLLPVKIDKPIKKENLFAAMEKANGIIVGKKVVIGDIVSVDFYDGANLIATDGII